MKQHRIYIFLALLTAFMPSRAAEGDSLQWDFTDLFQGTRQAPALPSSLEAWKEHLELFGKNIPQEEQGLCPPQRYWQADQPQPVALHRTVEPRGLHA